MFFHAFEHRRRRVRNRRALLDERSGQRPVRRRLVVGVRRLGRGDPSPAVRGGVKHGRVAEEGAGSRHHRAPRRGRGDARKEPVIFPRGAQTRLRGGNQTSVRGRNDAFQKRLVPLAPRRAAAGHVLAEPDVAAVAAQFEVRVDVHGETRSRGEGQKTKRDAVVFFGGVPGVVRGREFGRDRRPGHEFHAVFLAARGDERGEVLAERLRHEERPRASSRSRPVALALVLVLAVVLALGFERHLVFAGGFRGRPRRHRRGRAGERASRSAKRGRRVANGGARDEARCGFPGRPLEHLDGFDVFEVEHVEGLLASKRSEESANAVGGVARLRQFARRRLRGSSKREAERGASEFVSDVAAEGGEGRELVGVGAEDVVGDKVDALARVSGVDVGEERAVRVEEDHVAAAHETGHVREVIDGVEAHAETSRLANLLALDRVADATDALEVRLAEDAVVEDEKGGTLEPGELIVR